MSASSMTKCAHTCPLNCVASLDNEQQDYPRLPTANRATSPHQYGFGFQLHYPEPLIYALPACAPAWRCGSKIPTTQNPLREDNPCPCLSACIDSPGFRRIQTALLGWCPAKYYRQLEYAAYYPSPSPQWTSSLPKCAPLRGR